MTQEDPNKPNGGQPNPDPNEDPAKQGGGNGGGGGQEDRSKWGPVQWKQFAEAQEAEAKNAKGQLTEATGKLTKYESEKTEAEKKAQKDEEERQRKQGEFEQLANTKEARIKELEPQLQAVTAERDEYAGILMAQLEAEIKDWPAEAKKTDPGKEVPLKQRVAWKDNMKPLVEKLVAAPARQGNRPNPTPTGSAPNLDDNRAKQAQRMSIFR
ncbi:MAG: hypothetical protein J0I20_35760 [Chloroflexi bacterium]|nr:hypothetical protein [Chloroflexota bacterium]OJV86961.1 MAG: hypothetical protein BGO39_28575 [Chloroflexi bacterium 54-19]